MPASGKFMGAFDEIHALAKKRRHADVLRRLLTRHNRINERYAIDSSDKNHAWYIVGDTLYRKRKYHQALNAFRKAVAAWNKDGEALWAIGNCYSALQRPSMAEKYFRKSLRHTKGSHRRKVLYNLGNALFDQRKYNEAIKQYRLISRKERNVFSLAKKNIAKAQKRLRMEALRTSSRKNRRPMTNRVSKGKRGPGVFY